MYGEAEHRVIEAVWRLTDRPCGKRLKPILAGFLPHYERHRGALEDGVRARLPKISAAAIDRLPRPDREREREKTGGGSRRPRPGNEVRAQVPLREGPATGSEPGLIQADTVWHCGEKGAGTFACSLLLTCAWSHWTVVRATWNHSDRVIHGRVREIEETLPFAILGCHTDNGGEFINHTLVRYFRDRPVPVEHTRSRPYIKNDNAHAEERNRRRVRDFIGYGRIDDPSLVAPLDALMEKWSLWSNLFIPTGKLLHKERQGSKVRRFHEPPRTPCQRLLESPAVSGKAKTGLLRLLEQTDPITLRMEIDRERSRLLALAEKSSAEPEKASRSAA